MNIMNLFGGGSGVTAIATPVEQARTEQELSARLAAVQAQISAGDGDLVAALEEKEHLTRQIQAARIKQQKAKEQATKELRAAQRADLDRRVDAALVEIGTHIPRLLFALQDFDKVVATLAAGDPGAAGRPMTEILGGLDHNFARNLRAAIREIAPGVEWNYDAAYPGGEGSRPTPKVWGLKVPRFYTTDVLGNPIGTKYLP